MPLTRIRSLLAAAIVLVPALSIGGAGDEPGHLAPPVADHHLHLRSAALAAFLDEGGEGEAENGGAMADAAAGSLDALLRALDQAGVERGLLVSTAYRYGERDAPVPDEAALVAAENDFIAAAVERSNGRLAGVCAVNPLRDYALSELGRCAADGRFTALKLHFTNSGVDLRDPDHLARLAEGFRALEAHGLGALVHLRTGREDYGAEDARRFIDEVLAAAPTVPVQIAHMGGWGGYDAATDAALGAFVEALADGRLDRSRVFFDLGAVVFDPAAAGDNQALAEQVREANRTLSARIDALGADRVLFATDWPAWPPVPDPDARIRLNLVLLHRALPLDPARWAVIHGNRTPLLGAR